MKKGFIYFLLVLMSGTTSCSKSEDDHRVFTMTIASKLFIGHIIDDFECYAVKFEDNKQWEFLLQGIQGFDYVEGYEYVIKVRRQKREKGYIDAEPFEYIYLETISKVERESEGLPSQPEW